MAVRLVSVVWPSGPSASHLHSELHLWVITNGTFKPLLSAIPIGRFLGEEEERKEVVREEEKDDDLHMLLCINSSCL